MMHFTLFSSWLLFEEQSFEEQRINFVSCLHFFCNDYMPYLSVLVKMGAYITGVDEDGQLYNERCWCDNHYLIISDH